MWPQAWKTTSKRRSRQITHSSPPPSSGAAPAVSPSPGCVVPGSPGAAPDSELGATAAAAAAAAECWIAARRCARRKASTRRACARCRHTRRRSSATPAKLAAADTRLQARLRAPSDCSVGRNAALRLPRARAKRQPTEPEAGRKSRWKGGVLLRERGGTSSPARGGRASQRCVGAGPRASRSSSKGRWLR